MFKQEVPSVGLSLEQGTSAVPADGRYHLILDGTIIFSTASEKEALKAYREKREELFEERGRPEAPKPTVEERLEREKRHRDIQALRAESFERRTKHARKRGGKGGRGGV